MFYFIPFLFKIVYKKGTGFGKSSENRDFFQIMHRGVCFYSWGVWYFFIPRKWVLGSVFLV